MAYSIHFLRALKIVEPREASATTPEMARRKAIALADANPSRSVVIVREGKVVGSYRHGIDYKLPRWLGS